MRSSDTKQRTCSSRAIEGDGSGAITELKSLTNEVRGRDIEGNGMAECISKEVAKSASSSKPLGSTFRGRQKKNRKDGAGEVSG